MRPAVLVTGASSGIGRASVLRLANSGWTVFAGIRDPAVGEELAASAGSAGSIEPVLLDVTDAETIEASRVTIAGRVGAGGLRGLVNNASVVVGGALEFVQLAELRRQLEVNVVGQVAVTQAMLPLLRDAGSGRIVMISSDNGRWAPPFLGPYAASKFALEALGDALRVELRRSGVSVSIVEPGSVRTRIWEKGMTDLDELDLPRESAVLYGDVEGVLRKVLEQGKENAIPPDRVARAVHDALTARRPRTRYRVGRDARAMIALRALLPDRIFDFAVEKAMRRLERRA